MINLSTPNFNGNEIKYLKKCIETGWVSTSGPFINRFEKKILKYTSSKYAIGVINATSALDISLKLLGIKPFDEVIVPTLTFISPVNAILYNNARPIFMDCDHIIIENQPVLKNPDYGVIFTFYLNDDLLTKKEKRKKAEEKLEKSNSNIPFPGWEELDSEINERSPKIVIEIFDNENKFINRLSADYKKGFNRVSWDLKKEINLNVKSGSTRSYSPDIRVKPGKYSYNVYIDHNGEVNKIGSKFFDIERIRKGILTNPNEEIIEAREIASKHLQSVLGLSGGWVENALNPTPSNPESLSYFIAQMLQLDPKDRQKLLEEPSSRERLKNGIKFLNDETNSMSLRLEIELIHKFSRQ